MPHHTACLNWCSRLSRSPTVAIAPSALPKTSSLMGMHGSICVRTCLKRRLRSSSTGPGPSGFASTLSATRSCPSHDDPSRRLGHARRRQLIRRRFPEGRLGPFWRHFYDTIRSSGVVGHALACLLIIGERMRNAYIEENAVLAGLAATPEDWPWSSATKAKLLEHAPPQRRSEPTRPRSRHLGR